jgi:opacity protein-like surface antigen
MKKMKKSTIAILFLCLSSTAAYGQVAEFLVSGGISNLGNKTLYEVPGQKVELDDGWRLAFTLGLNSWTYFGHEFGYAYNRTGLIFDELGSTVRQGMAFHQGFYNFLVHATPEGTRIRPYATGGGHFSNFVPPGASATQGQGSNKFGFNYGGGVKVRIGDKWMVRLDVRQFITGKPFGDFYPVSGNLRQTAASIGFGFVM